MGDLAPSTIFVRHRSNHLFRALKFHMSEKSFDDVCQFEADIRKLFEAQPGGFYKDGTHSLPNNNSNYIVDCVYLNCCNELNNL